MARIVERWPTLPDHIRAAMLALVGTVPNRPGTSPASPSSPDAARSNSLDDALPPGFEKRNAHSDGG